MESEHMARKKAYEIGELDQYLFGQGTHYEIYKKLGAHLVKDGKKEGAECKDSIGSRRFQ